MYVNSVCANVHLTCGIRYKAGGSGNWIDLPCTLATISGGVTTVSTSSPVSIGDVVAVWVNDGAKTMYSPEVTVQASDFADPEYAFPAINSNFPLHYDNANVPYILSGTVNTALIGKQLPIVTLNGNHNTLYAHVDGGVGVRYLSKGYTLAGNATSSPISDVYFVLPALNGLTLTEVTATMGGDSQAGSWAVIESELGDVTGGDAVAVAKGASPAKFTLSGTTAGKAYKLYFTGAGTAQLAGLTVKYSGTELPTVQYVCKPVVSGSGISTVVYVNWACTNADLTGGYQYKAGGAGDWVNLNPSAFSALDKGVSTLSTARTLNAGDVVRAWASDGTKTVYSVEVTVE